MGSVMYPFHREGRSLPRPGTQHRSRSPPPSSHQSSPYLGVRSLQGLPSSSWCTGSEAADSRQDGGGAGRSRRNSAPCPPGTWAQHLLLQDSMALTRPGLSSFCLGGSPSSSFVAAKSTMSSHCHLSEPSLCLIPCPCCCFCTSLPGLTLAAQQGYGPHRSFIAAASVSTSSLSHQAVLPSCVELLWEKE